MLTKDEKEIVKLLVNKELDQVSRKGKTIGMDAGLKFLKAEHEYEHFLKKLLEKLV